MWLPRNIIYFMVYDINRDRKHLQQERLALQPRKNSTVQLEQIERWNLKHCNLLGMGKSNNCHTPLSSDIALEQRLGPISWSCCLGLCEFHSQTQNHELHDLLPHSSFPGWEGMDEHSHQMMEQHSQHTPESPCHSRRKVKKPGLTTSLVCAFSKERALQHNSCFPHHPLPCW